MEAQSSVIVEVGSPAGSVGPDDTDFFDCDQGVATQPRSLSSSAKRERRSAAMPLSTKSRIAIPSQSSQTRLVSGATAAQV